MNGPIKVILGAHVRPLKSEFQDVQNCPQRVISGCFIIVNKERLQKPINVSII